MASRPCVSRRRGPRRLSRRAHASGVVESREHAPRPTVGTVVTCGANCHATLRKLVGGLNDSDCSAVAQPAPYACSLLVESDPLGRVDGARRGSAIRPPTAPRAVLAVSSRSRCLAESLLRVIGLGAGLSSSRTRCRLRLTLHGVLRASSSAAIGCHYALLESQARRYDTQHGRASAASITTGRELASPGRSVPSPANLATD